VDGILRWGADVVVWMQQASPSLDGFFKALTFLGSQEFYLLLLPLVYWSVDRVLGVRLMALLIFSALINTVVKVIAGQPRPYAYDGRVKAIATESSHGFPSAHTQNAAAVWGLVASRVRRGWLWSFALAFTVAIGVSRVYLGVHFPTDVLGGLVIGAVVLWLFLRGRRPVERWFCALRLPVQLALVAVVPLVVLAFQHTEDVVTGVGATLGVAVGFVLERDLIGFETAGSVVHRVMRFVIGGVVLFGLWAGLRTLFAGVEPALLLRLVRYALVGAWVALGAPWLFLRVGIAGQKPA